MDQQKDNKAVVEKLKREREEEENAFRARPRGPLPTIQIRDETKYKVWVDNNSNDPYSYACIRFAVAWAVLMEKKLAEGAQLKDIAEACSHEADTEGITGFMYGAAKRVLEDCWQYGEELGEVLK